MVHVPPHNVSNRSIRNWCLLRHPVMNTNKPGKVRRVLNGASKFCCMSLNKSLLVGPDQLQNLYLFSSAFVSIILPYLLMFYNSKGCFTSYRRDVLQLGVPSKGQLSLLYLRCKYLTADLIVHQYTRHTFAARDLPTCASYALQRTALNNQVMFSQAAFRLCLAKFIGNVTKIKIKLSPLETAPQQ